MLGAGAIAVGAVGLAVAWWAWRYSTPIARAERAYAQQQWPIALMQAQLLLMEQPTRSDASLLAARCLYRLGRFIDAEAVFQREPDLSRFSREDLECRGQGLLVLQRWPQAIDVYQELHRRHPDDARALKRLAVLLFQTDKADDALPVAELLAKSFPDEAAAGYCIQGAIWQKLRNAANSADCFKKSLDLDSSANSLPVPRVRVIERLVDSLKHLGQLDEARSRLESEIARQPSAELLSLLAEMLRWQGETQGARERWLQALHLDRFNTAAWFGLGNLALEENHNAEAIGWLQQAQRRGMENSALHYALSRAYASLGQSDLAAVHDAESKSLRAQEESITPEDDSPRRTNTPEAKMRSAREALNAGAWPEAERHLRDLRQQFPSDSQVQALLEQVNALKARSQPAAQPPPLVP